MLVSIPDPQTESSEPVKKLESGEAESSTSGRSDPIAKPDVYRDPTLSKRIGVAKGRLKSPDELDRYNDEIHVMFGD